jgi:hypothetical protein
MPNYFFDFHSGNMVGVDEESLSLVDMGAAHREAVAALGHVIEYGMALGVDPQDFAIEIRDEFGPVLRVSAATASVVLRKQPLDRAYFGGCNSSAPTDCTIMVSSSFGNGS